MLTEVCRVPTGAESTIAGTLNAGSFKRIAHLKHFYRSNLIFWMVMRCGIGHAESTIAGMQEAFELFDAES